jgi:hypothetical protein
VKYAIAQMKEFKSLVNKTSSKAGSSRWVGSEVREPSLQKVSLQKVFFSVILGFKIAYLCSGIESIICLYVFDQRNMIFWLLLYLMKYTIICLCVGCHRYKVVWQRFLDPIRKNTPWVSTMFIGVLCSLTVW